MLSVQECYVGSQGNIQRQYSTTRSPPPAPWSHFSHCLLYNHQNDFGISVIELSVFVDSPGESLKIRCSMLHRGRPS